MDDLVKFLEARLAEDKLLALTAGEVRRDEWRAAPAGHQEGRVEDGHGGVVVYDEGSPTHAQAMHIARHDPARTLREVEAGQMILARYADCLARMEDDDYPQDVARDQVREYEDFVLPNLAVAYQDHPDYDEDWAP